MTTAATPTTPQIGDPVLFEGLPSTIVALVRDKVEFVSELKHTMDDGTVVPRFRTVANLPDMLWSSRLNAWYVWGRVLSKGRGAKDREGRRGRVDMTGQVGDDQRAIVAALRDRGIIPSREGRRMGAAPAAGEQHGLFVDLFADGVVNWKQELKKMSYAEGLSDTATSACRKHGQGFKSKRLNHGFADRNDGDPGYDAVAAEGTH